MFTRTTAFIYCALITGAAFAGPADELVKPCAECHGAAGVAATAKTPHISGQLNGYLQQEISALSTGERQSAIVNHVPKTWAAKDIIAAASFYAGSKAERPKQATEPEKVAKGAEIYKNRCRECHIENGRGSDKDAPLMAAQNLDYLSEQTKLYLSGKRRFPFMMDEAYGGLKAEDLEAVAHFFASQN